MKSLHKEFKDVILRNIKSGSKANFREEYYFEGEARTSLSFSDEHYIHEAFVIQSVDTHKVAIELYVWHQFPWSVDIPISVDNEKPLIYLLKDELTVKKSDLYILEEFFKTDKREGEQK